MAVIRAKRLWAASVFGGTLETLPAQEAPVPPIRDPDSGVRATWVYTVPAGKRAIVRTATFTLESPPGPTESPTMAAWLRVSGLPFPFAWFWFWFRSTEDAYSRYTIHAQFNGQLVLHAGDSVEINHGAAGIYLNCIGSGHELNEIS